jgi:hypothetical protein
VERAPGSKPRSPRRPVPSATPNNSAGRRAADAASGATGSYSYNKLGQVTSIGYGTGNDAQSFGYNTLYRLTSDTVNTRSRAAVASIEYGCDANDNLTSMITLSSFPAPKQIRRMRRVQGLVRREVQNIQRKAAYRF